ncbi:hypothetical protein [Parapedobacter tibetensis]|uniref:hypothetical protein n=1 Tax=Parapedobacter tibetensis TaxID=2972951 RepID=UPI00214D9827|nr:hypothetical protein [Parapedobacter tibetensis]
MRGWLLMPLVVIGFACASHRERRQSFLQTSEADVRIHRDSLWSLAQEGSWLVEVVELSAWNWSADPPIGSTDSSITKTIPTEGKTAPTNSSYIRLSRFTIRTDSKTVSTGRFTDSTNRYTGWIESKTESTKRETNRFTGYIVLFGLGLLVLLLVYRLVRKVVR